MDEFEEIWKIYLDAFPAEERRDIESQEQILKNPSYRLQPLHHNGKVIGFAALWVLKQFVFIEHLAIKKSMRGRGHGSHVIENLTTKYPRIVLEVEPPNTQSARQRIRFYRERGFHLNPYHHLQPPYQPGLQPVPLLLMTFPHPIDKAQFGRVRSILQSVVYGGGH